MRACAIFLMSFLAKRPIDKRAACCRPIACQCLQVGKEIKDLEAALAEKDALLRKSMDKVDEWEARFAALKAGQAGLVFEES